MQPSYTDSEGNITGGRSQPKNNSIQISFRNHIAKEEVLLVRPEYDYEYKYDYKFSYFCVMLTWAGPHGLVSVPRLDWELRALEAAHLDLIVSE